MHTTVTWIAWSVILGLVVQIWRYGITLWRELCHLERMMNRQYPNDEDA